MPALSIFVFVAFLMLFLGGVVLVHDPRSRPNQLFFLWVVFGVTWMVCNYLENVASFPLPVRVFFLRADFATGMLASGFILLFVVNFIDKGAAIRKLAAYFLPALLLAASAFTPWLLSKIYIGDTGDIQFDENFMFYFYAPALIVYFVVPCILLITGRRKADPHLRGQMNSIGIGLTATTIVTLTVNLYFQNFLTADQARVGIYAVLFFIIGTAWAIAKHSFLKIRFVVVEILFLGILATLLTRTILSQDAGEAVINWLSFFILLVLGFAMVRSFLNEDRQRMELQELTGRLEVSNKRLRQLDDLKTTMVAIASHQIRGPLGGIRGYLAMFRDGDLGPLTDKQREIVALNQNVLTRLINAVETFLDITKLESGHIMLKPEVVDLDEVIAPLVREFEAPMQRKGLKFRYDLRVRPPIPVKIDPEKTKHVIFNLIDNAIKYTESGSVTVVLRKEGIDAVVEVIDTGMGVPAEDIPRLFGKFERGELVVDRGGSGLGLYVVKMLTEMQGGRVWVSSQGAGLGTTFTVSLPLAKMDGDSNH